MKDGYRTEPVAARETARYICDILPAWLLLVLSNGQRLSKFLEM